MLDNYMKVMGVISPRIRKSLLQTDINQRKYIQEVRLRAGKPVALSMYDSIKYLNENGNLSGVNINCVETLKEDIEFTFKNVCQYSLHSFGKELSQGFVTIEGGNRVGLCGTAVVKENSIETIKNISGINIRIAREIVGCADNLFTVLFSKKISSTLIIGSPSSGKTTILRDLCRKAGNQYRVCVIDERNEISATVNGISQNDVGINTDVLCGYLKPQGITTAIRVLSPQIIICDEIGSNDDVTALSDAVNCGVKIIASAHAGSIEEIMARPSIKSLVEGKAFENIVLLGNNKNIGQIMTIKRMV